MTYTGKFVADYLVEKRNVVEHVLKDHLLFVVLTDVQNLREP